MRCNDVSKPCSLSWLQLSKGGSHIFGGQALGGVLQLGGFGLALHHQELQLEIVVLRLCSHHFVRQALHLVIVALGHSALVVAQDGHLHRDHVGGHLLCLGLIKHHAWLAPPPRTIQIHLATSIQAVLQDRERSTSFCQRCFPPTMPCKCRAAVKHTVRQCLARLP